MSKPPIQVDGPYQPRRGKPFWAELLAIFLISFAISMVAEGVANHFGWSFRWWKT